MACIFVAICLITEMQWLFKGQLLKPPESYVWSSSLHFHDSHSYFWFKYDLDRSTTHTMFYRTGFQTHDLHIMTVHFLALRTMQQKNLAHYVSLISHTWVFYHLGVALDWAVYQERIGRTLHSGICKMIKMKLQVWLLSEITSTWQIHWILNNRPLDNLTVDQIIKHAV